MTETQMLRALKQFHQDKRELARLEGEIRRMERLLTQPQTPGLRTQKRALTRQARSYIKQTARTIAQIKAQQRFLETRLCALPPLQQAVLRMRYAENLPWRKVADRTGYSEKHMFKIHRAALSALCREDSV
ncbi:MAG: sigma factor-like helix-turn-helix DNA-binding protein [Christensenellales bacterium]